MQNNIWKYNMDGKHYYVLYSEDKELKDKLIRWNAVRIRGTYWNRSQAKPIAWDLIFPARIKNRICRAANISVVRYTTDNPLNAA